MPSFLLRMHVLAEVRGTRYEAPINTSTFEGHLPGEFIFLRSDA